MEHVPSDWKFDDVFDAMELGCGQLLLDFRMHIRPLPEGSIVMLASRDIASPMEVPAHGQPVDRAVSSLLSH